MSFLNKNRIFASIGTFAVAGLAAWCFSSSPAEALSNTSEGAVGQRTVQDDAYRMDVSDWEGPAGEEGYVIVSIKANAGFKINKKYPQKVSLSDPPAGLMVPQRTLKMADAQLQGDRALIFTIPVTAERVGEFDLRGKIKLSVCSESQCRTEKHALHAHVVAQ
jgi:hypothetical protein